MPKSSLFIEAVRILFFIEHAFNYCKSPILLVRAWRSNVSVLSTSRSIWWFFFLGIGVPLAREHILLWFWWKPPTRRCNISVCANPARSSCSAARDCAADHRYAAGLLAWACCPSTLIGSAVILLCSLACFLTSSFARRMCSPQGWSSPQEDIEIRHYPAGAVAEHHHHLARRPDVPDSNGLHLADLLWRRLLHRQGAGTELEAVQFDFRWVQASAVTLPLPLSPPPSTRTTTTLPSTPCPPLSWHWHGDDRAVSHHGPGHWVWRIRAFGIWAVYGGERHQDCRASSWWSAHWLPSDWIPPSPAWRGLASPPWFTVSSFLRWL